jgi:hypothetical protein
VGGISSSAANIFFINTGTQSDATPRVFKVLLATGVSTAAGGGLAESAGTIPILTRIGDQLAITVDVPSAGRARITIVDSAGRVVRTVHNGRLAAGQQVFRVGVGDLAPGVHLVRLELPGGAHVLRFVR